MLASQNLGGLGVVTTPRLLELTVADHNNITNTVTAIDAAIRDLYVPEDETTHTAEIDVNALASSSDGTSKIHLSIVRDDCYDGWPVPNEKATSLDETLRVTDQARVFTVTAWLDKNGDNELDSGEELEQVTVHVEKPWSDLGTWTAGQAAMVKANADGASLDQLARDITGSAWDTEVLSHPAQIRKDDLIDVTPLLKVLEARTRGQIVQAALDAADPDGNFRKNVGFANGPNPPGYSLDDLKAAQINALFDSTPFAAVTNSNFPHYNCIQFIAVAYARGLLRGAGLSNAEWDNLNLNVHTDLGWLQAPYITSKTDTPLGQLKAGDWAGFDNVPGMMGPDAIWSFENVIKTGPDTYAGWGRPGVHPYVWWKTELKTIYNAGSQIVWGFFMTRPYVDLKDIPGYQGEAAFLNVPKLGQKIFEMKTGQAPPP
jgi:hypothetical protein